MPNLQRCLTWTFALLVCLNGRLLAQQPQPIYLKVQLDPHPQPIYLKVQLDPHLIDFDNPEARQQAFAQHIITELRNRHHTRYYVWHLEAAKPSDQEKFPELRIVIQRDQGRRDWLMQAILTLRKEPTARRIQSELKGILDPGEFDGDYPAGTEKGPRVVARFMRHFVEQPIEILDRPGQIHRAIQLGAGV